MNVIIKFLIRSNIFVALCAASLVWQTGLLMSDRSVYSFETLVVFLSTGFIYNLHRMQKTFALRGEMDLSQDGSYKLNRQMSVLFLIAFIPCLMYFNKEQYLCFLFGGILALAYSYGFLKRNDKWYNLRTLPFSKLFAIVFVWVLMTAVFPVETEDLFSATHVFILLERMFFLFAITIPFDIRDMLPDSKEDIKTLPIQLGWKFSRQLAEFSSLIFLIIVGLSYLSNIHDAGQSAVLALSALLTFYVIRRTTADSGSSHYTLALEGMSLVQSVLIGLLLLF